MKGNIKLEHKLIEYMYHGYINASKIHE